MADPLSVACPDCTAPAGTPCYVSGTNTVEDYGHAARQRSADLYAVEHGTCALCGRFMVYGSVQGAPARAWHPNPEDKAACPPMPDPLTDWNAYATAVNLGLEPGYPGDEHFLPADPAEHGRRLASERDDLIAAGVASETLIVPLHPGGEDFIHLRGSICPECRNGKHQNCDGTAWDDVADEATACDCAAHDHPGGQ